MANCAGDVRINLGHIENHLADSQDSDFSVVEAIATSRRCGESNKVITAAEPGLHTRLRRMTYAKDNLDHPGHSAWHASCVFAAEIDRIPRGTEITVRTEGPIRLNHWDRGRIYPAEVARNVYATDGDLAFPRGARADLIVREVAPHEMALDLDSVVVHGRRFVVDTTGKASITETGRAWAPIAGPASL